MTKFRGCIDIHAGQVKQIVGGTLTKDDVSPTDKAQENFVSTKPSSYYAQLYREHNVEGCHVIKLGTNPANNEAAQLALETWPNHLQVGGGITIDNADAWLNMGASHVIVTSWLFTKNTHDEWNLDMERLIKISNKIGKENLVVDLSCRRVIGDDDEISWFVATNKWQTITKCKLSSELLDMLSEFCDEFLIHAADVEGLCKGIDAELVENLGEWCPRGYEGKITYAGGAKSASDLALVEQLSRGKVDLTYGSSLDVFGGELVKLSEVLEWNERK
ncbi:phosphoribosylformimino-5-aminoimidazole carboxamide ribotide isomerase [Candidozyma auris]|nr:phosphoribosylformimino-5-aminoimidazole carboxamide ribotide isomerase [[Candida] auris]